MKSNTYRTTLAALAALLMLIGTAMLYDNGHQIAAAVVLIVVASLLIVDSVL